MKPNKEDDAFAPPDLPVPPAGYNQVDTDFDEQDDWKWDNDPLLEGEVIKIKSFVDESKKEPRPSKYMIVATGDRDVKMYMSKALEEFFETVSVGDKIWVLFKEKRPLGGGKTIRTFDAFHNG